MSPVGRIRLALSAAVVVGLLVAWWVGRHSVRPAAAELGTPAAPASTVASPGPDALPPPAAATVAGEKGALAAAANAVALIGSTQVLTPAGRAWLSEVLAVPARRATVRALLDRESSAPALAALRDDAERGVRFGLRSVPVALRAEQVGSVRASVSVFVAIYLAGSSQPASLGHGLMRVELAWTAAGWRLSDYRNTPAVGPIPVGYTTPAGGWQPVNGQNLILLSEELRQLLADSMAPGYAAP
ncbi:hypothetical protein ACFV1N_20630 [Streptosporangium canum]|uniref:hypothetical protein n=1 Tax=Streptosporangium canum TaxID=324952 RepID=UPI0036994420